MKNKIMLACQFLIELKSKWKLQKNFHLILNAHYWSLRKMQKNFKVLKRKWN